MKSSVKYFVIVLAVLTLPAYAQDPAKWEDDIKAIEKRNDCVPGKNLNLFTGSSSIARWTDINAYFPEYTVANRAFGGSQFSDLLYYIDRVAGSCKPAKIFIYEGDNDLAAGEAPEGILAEARLVREFLAKKFPKTPVVFISAKPSPSRWQLKESYLKLNDGLKKLSKKMKYTEFADLWTPMLDKNGQVLTNIFLEDNLHMNADGYKIWQAVLKPYLVP
jgi:lysophospholipase L1-like esterase